MEKFDLIGRKLMCYGAEICCRNFSGAKDRFGNVGKRKFLLILGDELAGVLLDKGWPVKRFNPKDDEKIGEAFLDVKVNFGKRPPRIFLITRKKKTAITEDIVHLVDGVEIDKSDISVNLSEWTDSMGVERKTVYLDTAYITVVEDCFASRYDYLDEDMTNDEEVPFD